MELCGTHRRRRARHLRRRFHPGPSVSRGRAPLEASAFLIAAIVLRVRAGLDSPPFPSALGHEQACSRARRDGESNTIGGRNCRSASKNYPPSARHSAKPFGAPLRYAPTALALQLRNLGSGQLFDADPGHGFDDRDRGYWPPCRCACRERKEASRRCCQQPRECGPGAACTRRRR
jgi:hypothetical protein